jgi:hypothetical protein
MEHPKMATTRNGTSIRTRRSAAPPDSVTVRFVGPDKTTPNFERFVEVDLNGQPPGDKVVVDKLYVRRTWLGDSAYDEGDELEVTIKVIKKS